MSRHNSIKVAPRANVHLNDLNGLAVNYTATFAESYKKGGSLWPP